MEKIVTEEQTLSAVQKEAFERAQKELNDYKKELESKKYLVDLKVEDIKAVYNYMSTEAPWKFTESLGIKEVVADLKTCVEKRKFFMLAISVEALYFYLSKIEGKGLNTLSSSITSLEQYLNILKSINVVRNVIAQENDKLKELEFIVASREEGIEVSDSVTDVN